MERIEADILIPGRGEPLHDGCVLLDGPTIAYAGPTAEAPPTPGAEIYRVPAVLPGLWDCHADFMGLFTPDLTELATNAPALTAMRVARDAAVALSAGFTSVREVGGLGVWVSRARRGGYGHWSERVRGRSGPQPDRWSCRLAHVPRALGL